MSNCGRRAFSRLRANSTCTPRLLPSSSCHSSAMNQSSFLNSSAAPFVAQHHVQALGRGDQQAAAAPSSVQRAPWCSCLPYAHPPSTQGPHRHTSVARSRRSHRPTRGAGVIQMAFNPMVLSCRARPGIAVLARLRRTCSTWAPVDRIHHAAPDRIGFTGARGCVQQSAATCRHVRPYLPLERLRVPSLRGEPGIDRCGIPPAPPDLLNIRRPGHGIKAFRSSNVFASAGALSRRHLTIRGKRTATPLL